MQEQSNAEPSPRRVKVTVMVSPETKDRLKEIGRRERRSVSSYLEGVIEHNVSQKGRR